MITTNYAVVDSDANLHQRKIDKLSAGKIYFIFCKNSHDFVNGIRFPDEKKNRHDDDMEFGQIGSEYVDT